MWEGSKIKEKSVTYCLNYNEFPNQFDIYTNWREGDARVFKKWPSLDGIRLWDKQKIFWFIILKMMLLFFSDRRETILSAWLLKVDVV